MHYTNPCIHSLTHTHTHTFNSPFSGTTQVNRCQNGKTNLDFTKARDSEWNSQTNQQTAMSVECGRPSGQWYEEIRPHLLHANLHWLDMPECDICQVQTLHDAALMPGRHCSTVSGGTLGTSLCDCIMTSSPFFCRQLTSTSSRSHMVVGRLLSSARRRGTHCRNALLFLVVHSKHSSSQSNLSN